MANPTQNPAGGAPEDEAGESFVYPGGAVDKMLRARAAAQQNQAAPESAPSLPLNAEAVSNA